MLSKWNDFWNWLPAWARTVLHVAGGAAVAYALSVGVDALSGGSLDTNKLFVGLLTAVMTAVLKGLNPADPAFGITTPPPVDPGVPVDPSLFTGGAA